jgi:hypothetical protein
VPTLKLIRYLFKITLKKDIAMGLVEKCSAEKLSLKHLLVPCGLLLSKVTIYSLFSLCVEEKSSSDFDSDIEDEDDSASDYEADLVEGLEKSLMSSTAAHQIVTVTHPRGS